MARARFKNIEIKVGLFIVTAVILVFILFISIGVSRDVFTTKVYINLYTDTAENIAKGMPLRYAGFQIARVGNISLQDDGRVILSVGIPVKYTKWVLKDSVFTLNTQNIIGAAFINVQTNLQSEASVVESGSVMPLNRDKGIQTVLDQLNPIVENLNDIVGSVAKILGDFSRDDSDFNKVLAGLGALGSDLASEDGTLSFLTRSNYVRDEFNNFLVLLRDFSESAVRMAHNIESGSITFKRSLEIFDEHAEPVASGADNITKEIETLVNVLRPSLLRLDKIALNLEKASQNAADGTENLGDLRIEIQRIVETGNEMLLKLQNTWPISLGNDKTPKKVPLK